MVGVEAALRGVPAVAFAVGGIPEWLSDGATGRLVPEGPKGTERFADAVAACLRDEPTLARMRDLGRAAAARFGMDLPPGRARAGARAAAGGSAAVMPVGESAGVCA
jgi:glycosyltransferase involved in cell wall biosynthesis